MLINKEIGKWCSEEYVTKLDDLAYQCLLNKYKDHEYLKLNNFISQVEMMHQQYHTNKFDEEYIKTNYLLRIEKINRIKDGIKN